MGKSTIIELGIIAALGIALVAIFNREEEVVEIPPTKPPEVKIVKAPEKPHIVEYKYRVIDKSRDEIKNFESIAERRETKFILLDFNKYRNPSRAMVVIMRNPPEDIVEASKKLVDEFCKKYRCGILRSGDYGRGIITNKENGGRGVRNVVHTELFDGKDKDMIRRVVENPRVYAQMLADTYGKVEGATFILPHESKKSKQGAYTYVNGKRMREREFARRFIIPHLQDILDENS